MSKQIEEVMELVDELIGESMSGGMCSIATNPDVAKQAPDFAKAITALKSSIEAKLRELLPVWQPIETAPADQWLLVAYADKEVSKAMLIDGQWSDWDGDFYGVPDHWMPLQKAPE